jgi:hypothetical protein
VTLASGADQAMANLNDVEFMGRTIRVNEVGCCCCWASCAFEMHHVYACGRRLDPSVDSTRQQKLTLQLCASAFVCFPAVHTPATRSPTAEQVIWMCLRSHKVYSEP